MQYLELQTSTQSCPYCGESIDLLIDTSVPEQRYIEDCQVCCRPITVSVDCSEQDPIQIQLYSENDADF